MDRILLVEDDAAIIRTLTVFLREEGFSVRSESGQTAAIAAMEAQPPDLALVDISSSTHCGYLAKYAGPCPCGHFPCRGQRLRGLRLCKGARNSRDFSHRFRR